MSWNFNHFLKGEMSLIERLLYRKPIKSLNRDLSMLEKGDIEEMLYGMGWMADSDMKRIPETDCASVMVLTPARIVIGAGRLTQGLEYHEIEDCYWIENDFCIVANNKETELGIGGIRFESFSKKYTELRCNALKKLVQRHIQESSPWNLQ